MKQTIIILLFLSITSLFAQEEKLMTLKGCIDLALMNNHDLLIQKNEVDKAELDQLGSWQGFMPRLGVTASGGKAETGRTRIFGQNLVGYDTTVSPPQAIYEAGWQDQNGFSRFNYQLAININWTIFDGLNTFYNIKRSSWNNEASQYELKSRINNTIQQVRVAYFEVLKYQKLVEVNELAVDRSMEQLRKQVLAFQIGSATRLDTLKAYVTYNNDRVSFINSANSLKQSQYTLNQVMGTDTGQPIKVASIDESQIPPLEDFQVLFDFVKQRNPDLRGSEARVNAANQFENQSLSPFIPSLSLTYQYARRQENADRVFYDFFSGEGRDLNWSTWFGWQISWNLFNGFGDYVNYQKAKIDLRNSEIREQIST